MYWIFSMKFIDLGDSCTVGGDPAMNIIIARLPVLNASEDCEGICIILLYNVMSKVH